jgi:hypothetical protein
VLPAPHAPRPAPSGSAPPRAPLVQRAAMTQRARAGAGGTEWLKGRGQARAGPSMERSSMARAVAPRPRAGAPAPRAGAWRASAPAGSCGRSATPHRTRCCGGPRRQRPPRPRRPVRPRGPLARGARGRGGARQHLVAAADAPVEGVTEQHGAPHDLPAGARAVTPARSGAAQRPRPAGGAAPARMEDALASLLRPKGLQSPISTRSDTLCAQRHFVRPKTLPRSFRYLCCLGGRAWQEAGRGASSRSCGTLKPTASRRYASFGRRFCPHPARHRPSLIPPRSAVALREAPRPRAPRRGGARGGAGAGTRGGDVPPLCGR